MEYKFNEIEEKWKKIWAEKGIYKVTEDASKPKYYVLDMFPYPSGAGLHVGHPLGYVASDIYARYKRLKGFNVLHPMGYDAFGLPAEQYAIETGTHPDVTTNTAIKRYREQLDKIGFSFDWSRQVKTCDPAYYKWTQWIFLKLYGSWYNRERNKAEAIETLIAVFENGGCSGALLREGVDAFSAADWKGFSEGQKQKVLMHYRLAFLSYAEVNWCEALGTVLANDEVKDGKSERGGHPVERRKMRQWFLRITEYSDRLLEGLNRLDWSEAMKEMQRNWIGRSEGASVFFKILTPNPSPKERGTSSSPAEMNNGTPGYLTGDPETASTNLEFAKEHRKNPTEAEAKLWDELRGEKLGYKFRRQHLIGKWIVDFACLREKLVVEVDGSIHDNQKEQDAGRTLELEQLGFTVIRFTNDEVLNDVVLVKQAILAKLKELQVTTTQENEADKALSFGEGLGEEFLEVFTTRPDTIFGATFMVIAPEHELVESLTTPAQKQEVEQYIAYVKSRTDVERQQEKRVTGAFTGAYASNPFNGQPIPIWIAEYVLAGYGTGAIMAVPADDERDRKFAEKFGLPIVDIIDKSMYPGATIEDKLGKMINSEFLNGLEVKDAIQAVLDEIEKCGIGSRKVNYKQRDAGYSRQRYWGEPFPIKYKVQGEPDSHFAGGEDDDIPLPLSENELPLVLPEVSSFKPTGDGQSPLANNADWVKNGYETDTMPGYAGSSWYFLRYMDPQNPNAFASKEKLDYWKNVDIYFGGAEHAVGHLLYSRMWHKFLFDLGYVPTDEPFQKMVNQGMIQGVSAFINVIGDNGKILKSIWSNSENLTQFPLIGISNNKLKQIHENSDERIKFLKFYHESLTKYNPNYQIPKIIESVGVEIKTTQLRVDISIVALSDKLDIEQYKKTSVIRNYVGVELYTEDDATFICDREVEKMSKSKYNVVNPDDVIEKNGADCFRMFEMFLGPIEQSKPWDDKGISGVSNFLRKFWRLFYDDKGNWRVTEEPANDAELKVLHKHIKKIADDIERLNYNTCVSGFMITTNELNALACTKRAVLEPLLITLAPFAPFITEELWEKLGHSHSIHTATFPAFEEKYLVESSHDYAVSINGKVRAQIVLPLDITQEDALTQVLALENVQKWTNGNQPKKFIFVKGKIINLVV
ncbi:MAG: class I tRNA ligase family protein [Chitinophagales bacterium]